MADREDPKDASELRNRLAALKSAIETSRNTDKIAVSQQVKEGDKGLQGIAAGLRVLSELVAGVLVGAGLGYGLDTLFGTKPWLLLVFVLFGVGAGMRNVYRLGMRPTQSPTGGKRD